ncbi:CDC5 cell division cycle 5-like protein [Coelomomyces lativittatus]|nr:CDC5 cell division cycle 5-like protein [Coelomomyces lativittatus]
MPTQWRTLAPIVGRTPAQCLDRYQKLLDAAEKELSGPTTQEGSSSSSSSSSSSASTSQHHEDVRRLRPGEIDPDPETKPARPDPVDMDEDEKEMLSEARARLANTQGKKAKRKARERQLEESRRLAALQKRRELKAAGILVGTKKRRGDQLDYNIDIPFQRKPMVGPFDTTEELKKTNGLMFGEWTLAQLEGKRKAEKEMDERRKDAKKRKGASDMPMFIPSSKNASIFDTPTQAIQRAPLHLPAPQVTEDEIQALAKLGATQVPMDSMVASDFVSAYTSTPRVAMRTPSVPVVDHVKQQARMLAQSQHLSTPLLGEEDSTQYVPPATTILPTPHPPASSTTTTPSMATFLHSSSHSTPSMYRDRMGINTPRVAATTTATTTTTDLTTPSTIKTTATSTTTTTTPLGSMDMEMTSLRVKLAQLPAPKNAFTLHLPELPSMSPPSDPQVEDRSTEDVPSATSVSKLHRSSLFHHPMAPLPRPPHVPSLSSFQWTYPLTSSLGQAEQMIFKELVMLMYEDAMQVPIPGHSPPRRPSLSMSTTMGGLGSKEEKEDDEEEEEHDRFRTTHNEDPTWAGSTISSTFLQQARQCIQDAVQDSFLQVTPAQPLFSTPRTTSSSSSSTSSPPWSSTFHSMHTLAQTLESECTASLQSPWSSSSSSSPSHVLAMALKHSRQVHEVWTELQVFHRTFQVVSQVREVEQAWMPTRVEALVHELASLKQNEKDLQSQYWDGVKKKSSQH